MTEASCRAHHALSAGRVMRIAMVTVLSAPTMLLVLVVATGTESGPRVTSDTAEYCSSLAARVAGLPAARQEPSRSLAAEGVRLCATGHVRPGIAKLRRAVKAAQAEP